MGLRIFIMSFLGSCIITFTSLLNVNTIITGHELGIKLANLMGVDPYLQLSVAGAGIAYDIMIILTFTLLLAEIALLPKVYTALVNFNDWLWKKLEY